MIRFLILVVWSDSDSEWYPFYFQSFDDMLRNRASYMAKIDQMVRAYVFQDKEIPNHVVSEYMGYFCRIDNGIKFVEA